MKDFKRGDLVSFRSFESGDKIGEFINPQIIKIYGVIDSIDADRATIYLTDRFEGNDWVVIKLEVLTKEY